MLNHVFTSKTRYYTNKTVLPMLYQNQTNQPTRQSLASRAFNHSLKKVKCRSRLVHKSQKSFSISSDNTDKLFTFSRPIRRALITASHSFSRPSNQSSCHTPHHGPFLGLLTPPGKKPGTVLQTLSQAILSHVEHRRNMDSYTTAQPRVVLSFSS